MLVIDDLNHSIHNWLNNIVEHITSPRIWTFTVLQSLALHITGQRPLEDSSAVRDTKAIMTLVAANSVYHKFAWLK